MFFPLSDDNPTQRRPIVNYTIIAINVVAFLLTLAARDPNSVIQWTMVPADLHWPTLFTSLFLHAGWLHLIGNLWMLWIFGDNVEDRLGHLGYVVFYFVCGLAADAAHIATNPGSDIPTLGASGAISGVMGAYLCLFPRQRVKTLIFFGFFFDFWLIPAFVWIGIWFLEQVLLSTKGLSGGVAYMAHIGGFVAGAAIAAAIRIVADRWPSSRGRAKPLEPRTAERRLFTPIPDDPGFEFIDEPGDGYSVLRLSEDPQDIARIGQVVAGLTGESATDVSARVEATRGMIARSVPRETAGRIQRELHVLGIPSAIILHNRSNFPPTPIPVGGVSWDDRTLRLRASDQIVIPWSAPFLFVAARVDGKPFVDLFVNRSTAYRILDARHVPMTDVDPSSRKEVSTDLAGFARAALDRAGGAAMNEGVRAAASGSDWGRLDFRTATDYDDYIFWLYNLILAKGSPRG